MRASHRMHRMHEGLQLHSRTELHHGNHHPNRQPFQSMVFAAVQLLLPSAAVIKVSTTTKCLPGLLPTCHVTSSMLQTWVPDAPLHQQSRFVYRWTCERASTPDDNKTTANNVTRQDPDKHQECDGVLHRQPCTAWHGMKTTWVMMVKLETVG